MFQSVREEDVYYLYFINEGIMRLTQKHAKYREGTLLNL